MAPTPFEHGLALAWSDGALSRQGAQMLENLQEKLDLNDFDRAAQEEKWLESISKGERRSFGDGDEILKQWLDSLNDLTSLENSVRMMGKAALKVGLSKKTWLDASIFSHGLGLGQALAEGAWLEVATDDLGDWPAALDPLAVILGLVINIQKTVAAKSTTNPVFVNIDYEGAKSEPLSWMPDLLPIENEQCAWGWKNVHARDTEPPERDLVYCNSVLIAWVRRLVAKRHERGEPGLSGLPEGLVLMPSSSSLSQEGNELTISMIVDLGDSGLVRPWAKIIVDGAINIVDAPDTLADNWVGIHDALAGLLIHGLQTLPRQLVLASGLDLECRNVSIDGGWIVHDLGTV